MVKINLLAEGKRPIIARRARQAGFQINIPRLFAALALISVTGVILFWAMLLATRLALGSWHESMAKQER